VPAAAAAAPAQEAAVVFELVSYSRGLCAPTLVGGPWVRAMQRAFARGVGDRFAAAATADGGR